MSTEADAFMKRHGIEQSDILYIIKEDRKTAVFLRDGSKIHTAIPAKRFMELMPDTFVSVNKGVLLSRNEIVSIDRGYYLMSDGSRHKGRVRTPGQHKRNRELLTRQSGIGSEIPAELRETVSVFGRLPMGASIIELVFESAGHGVDFIIRYCNEECARAEGVSVEDMLGHSFFEVFSDRDNEWVFTYVDVAINGTDRIVERVLSGTGETYRIYCFRPVPNYCACILVPIS